MNKLWRFGDSYSQVMENKYPGEKNHSYWVAEYFGLKYINRGQGGLSILDCLLMMLESSNDMRAGDMILFNLPVSDRLGFYDEAGKQNSSRYRKEELFLLQEYKDLLISNSYKYVNYTIIGILSTFLENKIKHGIKVYVFINDKEEFNKFNIPNQIRFKESAGFIDAVNRMGFEDHSSKGNLHYLYGVQKTFSEKIIETILDFTKNRGNTNEKNR